MFYLKKCFLNILVDFWYIFLKTEYFEMTPTKMKIQIDFLSQLNLAVFYISLIKVKRHQISPNMIFLLLN
jgi:hypothetical protein